MLFIIVPDNEGTEFVFAFGSNYPNDGGSLEVFVTTKKPGPVFCNYTYNSITTVSYSRNLFILTSNFIMLLAKSIKYLNFAAKTRL